MPPDVLLERITAYIEGLDASAWQQGTWKDSWTEAAAPFSTEDEPDSTRHLSFVVTMPTSVPVNGDPETGEESEVQSTVEVLFEYRLQPTEQMADYRRSHAAARQIAKAINNDTAWVQGGDGEVTVRLFDLGSPQLTSDGGAVVMRVVFTITHDEEF